MGQYISKSALVAEIEKCYNECLKKAKITDSDYWNAKADAYRNVLTILNDALEVKDVDLNKYINKYFKRWYIDLTDQGNILNTPYGRAGLMSVKEVAKHFFKLGLKSKIMTSKLQQRISVLKMGFWTGLQTFEETEMTLSDAYNQGVDDILEELGLKAQKGEKV